jgi:hypothetical protein
VLEVRAGQGLTEGLSHPLSNSHQGVVPRGSGDGKILDTNSRELVGCRPLLPALGAYVLEPCRFAQSCRPARTPGRDQSPTRNADKGIGVPLPEERDSAGDAVVRSVHFMRAFISSTILFTLMSGVVRR